MQFIRINPENNNAEEFTKLTSKMPTFVKLFSPGCQHCTSMQPAWDELENNEALKDYNIAVIEVQSDLIDKINSPAMKVNGGFPTIRKVLINGSLGPDYNGNRTAKDMIAFIQKEFKESKGKNPMAMMAMNKSKNKGSMSKNKGSMSKNKGSMSKVQLKSRKTKRNYSRKTNNKKRNRKYLKKNTRRNR
jgi:hypothetical protein